MDPVTVSTTIAKPREQVFEYLSDIANHAQFTDHYLVDWRLTRENSVGRGAGARFKVKAPLSRFAWADLTIAEVETPHRIVERGRGGKYNRVRIEGVYTLSPATDNTTTVQYTLDAEPKLLSDRMLSVFTRRKWNRRQAARALRRLRSILEDGRDAGPRASIASR